MRDFKKTILNHEIYLYPVPVIKNLKYLIRCSDIAQLEIIKKLIQQKVICHPDDLKTRSTYFDHVGTHSDKKTPVLELKSDKT